MLVTSLSDVDDGDTNPGEFSLREAVRLANASETPTEIAFDVAEQNPVIDISGQLVITRDVTISGRNISTEGGFVTLDGGGTGRLFWVSGPSADPEILASLTLEQMTLQNGNADGSDHPADPEHDDYRADGGAVLKHRGSNLLRTRSRS